MPNPLAYIGQGLGALGRGMSRLPARLMPHPGLDSVASDMGGYSGQGALYDDTAPADTDDPGAPGQYSSPLPPMSSPVASGSQVSGGTLPPRSGPISYGEFDTPTNRAIQSAANPPPLPHRASGVRGFFGTLASMSPVTAPFANQIAYGSKGMEQLRNRQDYESNLPHQIKAADLYNTQERTRAMDQDRNETARQRQQTFDMNRANIEADNRRADQQELGRFEDKGGKLLYDQQSDLTMPSAASTPSVLPSRQSLDSTWQGPEQPSMEDLPLRGTPNPSSLPRSVTLPAAAQVEPGYQREPSATYDPKGSVRSRPTPDTLKRQEAEAQTIPTPPDLLRAYPGIGARIRETTMTGMYNALATNNRSEADRLSRESMNDDRIAAANERAANTLAARGDKDTARWDKSHKEATASLDKIGKPITDIVARTQRLQDTLSQNSPQADALVAPELLTVMAGGAGSGLRMNEAEISRIIGGRSKWEDLKAAINKWQLDPKAATSITPDQRKQIRDLVNTVHTKIKSQQSILEQAYEDIDKASTTDEHNTILTRARKAVTAASEGGNKLTPAQAQDYLRKVGWTGGSPTPAQKSAAEAAAKADGREF